MKKINFLNSREIKKILHYLDEDYGAELSILRGFAYHENSLGKIFITGKDIGNIHLDKINAQVVGLYFGERVRDSIRLSIWGSEIAGKYAKKNVVDLSEEEARSYFRGEDLDIDLGEKSKWVILRYKGIFLGSAGYSRNKVFNYLPKEHRTADIILH